MAKKMGKGRKAKGSAVRGLGAVKSGRKGPFQTPALGMNRGITGGKF